jgi:hypothetical protein
MKTPREILLAQHELVVPELNAIRRKVLTIELRARTSLHPWRSRCLAVPWRELIRPYRRIWAGLAMVWLVIFAVNLSLRDESPTVATKAQEPSPEFILAFWQQERLLAELIEPHPRRLVVPLKPTSPQPRSQRRTEFLWS